MHCAGCAHRLSLCGYYDRNYLIQDMAETKLKVNGFFYQIGPEVSNLNFSRVLKEKLAGGGRDKLCLVSFPTNVSKKFEIFISKMSMLERILLNQTYLEAIFCQHDLYIFLQFLFFRNSRSDLKN